MNDDEQNTYLLTVLSYDQQQECLNKFINFSETAIILGFILTSLVKYDESSVMICGTRKAIVLDLNTMCERKTVNLNSSIPLYPFSTQLLEPLVSQHMIPQTGQKFALEFSDHQFVYIRTIETGAR